MIPLSGARERRATYVAISPLEAWVEMLFRHRDQERAWQRQQEAVRQRQATAATRAPCRCSEG